MKWWSTHAAKSIDENNSQSPNSMSIKILEVQRSLHQANDSAATEGSVELGQLTRASSAASNFNLIDSRMRRSKGDQVESGSAEEEIYEM